MSEAKSGARCEATSKMLLVVVVGGMCEGEERSDEQMGASEANAEKTSS